MKNSEKIDVLWDMFSILVFLPRRDFSMYIISSNNIFGHAEKKYIFLTLRDESSILISWKDFIINHATFFLATSFLSLFSSAIRSVSESVIPLPTSLPRTSDAYFFLSSGVFKPSDVISSLT